MRFYTQFGENWKNESTFFLQKTNFHPSKWNSNETIRMFAGTKLSGYHRNHYLLMEANDKHYKILKIFEPNIYTS